MVRLKRFFGWKIKTQMLVSMMMLIFLTAAVLAVANWGISKGIIEENYRKTNESNLKSFNSILDYKLSVINELVRAEIYQQTVYDVLEEDSQSGGKYFSSGDTLTLNRMAQSLESQSTLIDAVFVFDNQDRYFQHFRGNFNSSEYMGWYSKKDVAGEDWYQEAQAAKGKECYFGYDVLLPEGEEGDIISLVKEIRNPSTQKPLGMLIISLNNSFLRSSLVGNNQEFKSDTLMIIDPRKPQKLVYYTGDEAWTQKVIDAYMNEVSGQGKEFLFTSYKNYITGWEIVNGIARSDLSRDSVYIGTSMALASVCIVLIGAALSGFISRKINRPLHRLELVLQKVQQGSRHIEEEFDDSEIGKVGNILKETVNHNIELKERLLKMDLKERESELLLLQAQINPHFLYNTLDSIYCQAKLKGEEGIASMVNNLSETFKISLSNGRQKISVADEVKYIRRYMEIQNVRYEGRFELIIEIDEELMDLHIIKLILQPFVENSMYHGLEMKPGPGFIEIKGERIENDLYFTVSDNGVGMKNPDDIYSGFGVKNVVDRIRLFYGKEYGIEVQSKFGTGTKVNIHIPVMEEERIDNDDACSD